MAPAGPPRHPDQPGRWRPLTFVTILMTMSSKLTPKVVKAGEFKAKCLELMDDVAASGDVIVITKRGKPVACLGPVLDRPARLFGFLSGNCTFVGDLLSPVQVDWGPAAPDIRKRPVQRKKP